MKTYIYIFGLLLIGFVVYFYIKDSLFSSYVKVETFEIPAPASIEIRKAPIYPQREVESSGPNPPSQEAPNGEIVVHGAPGPKDPYYEAQESSDIPENLRYPERSFRPPPLNDNTSMAVEAGIASNTIQTSSDNSQKFSTEFIEGGGEFMPGIFANDSLSDTNYSTF
jgi:hypothetical protein